MSIPLISCLDVLLHGVESSDERSDFDVNRYQGWPSTSSRRVFKRNFRYFHPECLSFRTLVFLMNSEDITSLTLVHLKGLDSLNNVVRNPTNLFLGSVYDASSVHETPSRK